MNMPTAAYMHRSAVPPEAVPVVVDAWKMADRPQHDVVKLSATTARVSLLSYPDFFTSAFPQLVAVWTVDLNTGRVQHRSYENGPIIHRKELMLHKDHPKYETYAKLTRQLVEAGAYDGKSNGIGSLKNWNDRLRRLGIRVDGHTMTRVR